MAAKMATIAADVTGLEVGLRATIVALLLSGP